MEQGIALNLQWKSNFNFFLMKNYYSFRRLNCKRELIPDCYSLHSYRDNMLVNIELNFRNKTLLGNGLSKGPMDIRELLQINRALLSTFYVGW